MVRVRVFFSLRFFFSTMRGVFNPPPPPTNDETHETSISPENTGAAALSSPHLLHFSIPHPSLFLFLIIVIYLSHLLLSPVLLRGSSISSPGSTPTNLIFINDDDLLSGRRRVSSMISVSVSDVTVMVIAPGHSDVFFASSLFFVRGGWQQQKILKKEGERGGGRHMTGEGEGIWCVCACFLPIELFLLDRGGCFQFYFFSPDQ